MRRISVDNGHSFVDPVEALDRVSMRVMIEYMDTVTYEDMVMNCLFEDDLTCLRFYLANAPEDLIIG